ncbi:hypothetical protein [Brevibacillus parabrevis]|uniref:hypothetical protein n=1 Tax=Brevibacillus parabrevis TaxID=54914 RepID=UPI0036F196F0
MHRKLLLAIKGVLRDHKLDIAARDHQADIAFSLACGHSGLILLVSVRRLYAEPLYIRLKVVTEVCRTHFACTSSTKFIQINDNYSHFYTG